MKVLICIAFLTLVTKHSFAAEAGYNEAMGYFVQRRNIAQGQNQPKESPVYQSLEPDNLQASYGYQSVSSKRTKYFFSVGSEQASNSYESMVFEFGVSSIALTYIQSNLSLEWRPVVGDEDGDAVSFMYSIQPSSLLYFLGPEIGFGAGRAWIEGDGEGYTSLKLGLNISNKWTKSYLVSLSVYYRRDQGLRQSDHDDRFGALLRFGF